MPLDAQNRNMTIYCEGFRKNKPDDFVYVEDRTPVFINEKSKKLIIGTMISYKGRFLQGASSAIDPSFDFFYPNIGKNSLWSFLSQAFSGNQLPLNKSEKEKFLRDHNLGMTNLIQAAYCKPNNSDDSQIVIHSLKTEIGPRLKDSKVIDLYFTSANTRNLFWLFLEMNKYEYQFIEDNKDSSHSKISLFERDFAVYTLPTPVNRGRKGETKDWKLAQYRKMLNQA